MNAVVGVVAVAGKRVAAYSVVALLLGCAPALAANQTVTATSSSTFVQKEVTIAPGESVTWNNAGGFHNVHFDDNSFVMPPAPSPPPWSVSHTFGQVGTYRYYCEAHGGPGGAGMAGTVVVSSGGPPVPPGTGGQSPAPDVAKPVPSITAPSKQAVTRLYVRASMNEAGTITATGSVNVPRGTAKVYRFRPVTRTVSPNAVVKLRLKLSKKSLKTVRRALRRKRLRAKVTVTAEDTAGNRTVRKRRILLTR